MNRPHSHSLSHSDFTPYSLPCIGALFSNAFRRGYPANRIATHGGLGGLLGIILGLMALGSIVVSGDVFAASVARGDGFHVGGQSLEYAGSLRRFALIVASNNGGMGRGRLQYAADDAETMARVLAELGGVAKEDIMVLSQPDAAMFRKGLASIHRELSVLRTAASEQPRIELIFYYSGHSDGEGLLVEGERFSYRDLRNAIKEMPADVRIAILDSCASGALTREKGGVRTAPFLLDAASAVEGHAFLTSSSASEVAQEADHLGGSFFTHYLVSGLRGAADTSGDGKVTLNEAYQFAFNETLAGTERTLGGAQHPNYDFRLAGSGDVVLTDLRESSAVLVLDGGLDGRFYVRDADSSRLVVELNKGVGEPVQIGLGPGRYLVAVRRGGGLYEAIVQLGTTKPVLLTEGDLELATKQTSVAMKGLEGGSGSGSLMLADGGEAAEGQGGGVSKESNKPGLDEVATSPFRISILPGFASGVGRELDLVRVFVQLSVLGGRTAYVHGLDVASVFSLTDVQMAGVQASGVFNKVGGSVYGLQAGGVFNQVDGGIRGIQSAGVWNRAGDDSGGIQVGGVFNLVNGNFDGIQGAGVFNHLSGRGAGVQVAGVANITGGSVAGIQGAGVFNSASEISGLQVAGIFNKANRVDGLQAAGLVNVAGHVNGVQFGLVNVADSSDFPIGLVNIIDDGIMDFGFYASESLLTSMMFRSGGRNFYTIINVGLDAPKEPWIWTTGAGLGGRLALFGPVYANLDIMSSQLFKAFSVEDQHKQLAQARLWLEVDLAGAISLFGGATYNFMFYDEGGTIIDPPWTTREYKAGGFSIKEWPGFFGGVKVSL